MFYLDNSETSWLVYADWLEDQDVDATHIRQAIVSPITNTWHYECCDEESGASYDDGVGSSGGVGTGIITELDEDGDSEGRVGGDNFHDGVGYDDRYKL